MSHYELLSLISMFWKMLMFSFLQAINLAGFLPQVQINVLWILASALAQFPKILRCLDTRGQSDTPVEVSPIVCFP